METRTDCWGTFAKNVENSLTGAVSRVSLFWPGRTRKNADGVGESCEEREASWSFEKCPSGPVQSSSISHNGCAAKAGKANQ
jgi:hypothetical protein